MISVIMPIYNSSKYLKDTIDSIMNQKYKDFELILVDDGSKDNSYEICLEYQNRYKNVKAYRKNNEGVSKTRNYGIDKANGDYICFFDADDECGLNYLSDFSKYQNYDLVCCGMEWVYPNKTNYFKYCGDFDSDTIANKIFEIINSMVFNSPVNKLYKRDIIKSNNIRFNEQMDMGEDFVFNLDYLTKCTSFKFIDNLNYRYLIRTNSITTRYRENELYTRRISINKLEEYCLNHNLDLKFINNMKIKLAYSCAMQELNFKNKNNIFEKIKNDNFFKIDGNCSNLMKILLYFMQNKFLFNFMSRILYIVKYKVRIKWKGASI